jgi:hypothetical protein
MKSIRKHTKITAPYKEVNGSEKYKPIESKIRPVKANVTFVFCLAHMMIFLLSLFDPYGRIRYIYMYISLK